MTDRVSRLESEVAKYPEQIELRNHLVHALLAGGRTERAIEHLREILYLNVAHQETRSLITQLNPHAWTGWVTARRRENEFTVWEPGRTWKQPIDLNRDPPLDWSYAHGIQKYSFDVYGDATRVIRDELMQAWNGFIIAEAPYLNSDFAQAFPDSGQPGFCYSLEGDEWITAEGSSRARRRPIWHATQNVRYEFDEGAESAYRVKGNKFVRLALPKDSTLWYEDDKVLIRYPRHTHRLGESEGDEPAWQSLTNTRDAIREDAQNSPLNFPVPSNSRFARKLNCATPLNFAHFEHIGFEKGYEVPITVLDQLRARYERGPPAP